MSWPVKNFCRKLARYSLDLLKTPAVILAYHRVGELESDPQLLSVSSENFTQQIQALARKRKIVPLMEMADRIRRGENLFRLAAITFDDGYCDNLHIAEPILNKIGAPATVFVTSSMIDSPREFWWDRLEALLLIPERLPQTLNVDICGEKFSFDLSCPPPNKNWNVLKGDNNNARCKSYLRLCELLKQLASELRDNCLNNIATQLGIDEKPRRSHLCVSRDELARLAHSSIIDIGAHTATHSCLASLSSEKLTAELTKPKEILSDITGYDIQTMSYPFGSRADVDNRVIEAAQNTNYSCACVNWPGYVRRNENLLQLPRVIVRNFTGNMLQNEIAKQCNMYL